MLWFGLFLGWKCDLDVVCEICPKNGIKTNLWFNKRGNVPLASPLYRWCQQLYIFTFPELFLRLKPSYKWHPGYSLFPLLGLQTISTKKMAGLAALQMLTAVFSFVSGYSRFSSSGSANRMTNHWLEATCWVSLETIWIVNGAHCIVW